MNKLRKIVSSVVVLCFLANTALPGYIFAQDAGTHNLATSSKFDNLTGLEPQDIGRIKAVLLLNLTKATHEGAINFEELIQVAGQFRDSVYKTQIMFRERRDLPNGYTAVLCKTREGDLAHGAGKYYAVIPKEAKGASLPIYVYTEKRIRPLQGIRRVHK